MIPLGAYTSLTALRSDCIAEPRSLSFLQALRHCGDVVRFVGIVLGDDRHGL
jgi:hypothetical protein